MVCEMSMKSHILRPPRHRSRGKRMRKHHLRHIVVMLAVAAAWLADGPAYGAFLLALAAYTRTWEDT